MNVLLFGDQTADQYQILRRAVLHKHNAILTSFLEHATLAVKNEIRRLPRWRRNAFPDFSSMNSLVEHYYAQGTKIEELESCLVTVAQLAHYIE